MVVFGMHVKRKIGANLDSAFRKTYSHCYLFSHEYIGVVRLRKASFQLVQLCRGKPCTVSFLLHRFVTVGGDWGRCSRSCAKTTSVIQLQRRQHNKNKQKMITNYYWGFTSFSSPNINHTLTQTQKPHLIPSRVAAPSPRPHLMQPQIQKIFFVY